MRLVRRGPLGDGPEGIHQTSGTIGEFVGEPPLLAEGSVGFAGQTLKIGYPVEGAEGFFLITRGVALISGSREVQRFDGREARGVAVAALIWLVAAEIYSVALFGGYQCSV